MRSVMSRSHFERSTRNGQTLAGYADNSGVIARSLDAAFVNHSQRISYLAQYRIWPNVFGRDEFYITKPDVRRKGHTG
jgi:hypothetical protein